MKNLILFGLLVLCFKSSYAVDLGETIVVSVTSPDKISSITMSRVVEEGKKINPYTSTLHVFDEKGKITEVDLIGLGAASNEKLWKVFHSSVSSWTFSAKDLLKARSSNSFTVTVKMLRKKDVESSSVTLVILDGTQEFEKVKSFMDSIEKLTKRK